MNPYDSFMLQCLVVVAGLKFCVYSSLWTVAAIVLPALIFASIYSLLQSKSWF